MPKKVSILTSPIVELGSTRFIEETVKFASSVGEKVVAFNLFYEILEQAGLHPQNPYEEILFMADILDGYSYQFQCMREKAYLSIARKIDRLGSNVSAIILTPASVEWR